MGFEKKLKELENIVAKMEGGDLSLDESLKLFEKGVKASRDCQKNLDEAEEKVQILLEVDEDGEAITEDFEAEA